MSPLFRQSISTSIAVLLLSAVGWPLLEAVCDSRFFHRHFTDALLLASLGAPGSGELPLSAFWVILFAPICVIAAVLCWKRRAALIIPFAAIAGAVVAPLQWSIANHAYHGGLANCISDVPGFTSCGLPSTYRLTFAIAGAIVGLAIGAVVARVRIQARTPASTIEPLRMK